MTRQPPDSGGSPHHEVARLAGVNDSLRCAVENVAIGTRRSVVGRWRDGIRSTSAQVDQYRWAWEDHNASTLHADGPLWVVLGDSAAQGVGASSPFHGWVGQALAGLRDGSGEPWRVVNLSVSGARVHDVLDHQLPRLWRLDARLRAGGRPPISLVTCAVGGNDMYRSRSWQIAERFPRLLRGLPGAGQIGSGSRTIITTLPQGLARRRAELANDIIAGQAPDRGLDVADLWATTGPPWQGNYAEDFFHPNDRGYGHWVRAILPVMLDATSQSAAA